MNIPQKQAKHAAYLRLWRKRHPEYKEENRENQRSFIAKHPGYYETWRRNHPIRIKELHRKATRRHRQKHPKRVKARMQAQQFPLGPACELCPRDDIRTSDLERHHPDYDYPEIFVTVCSECRKWISRCQGENAKEPIGAL